MALRDKYDVLRIDHQTALDALNAHMEQAPQPTQDAGAVDRTHDAEAVDREPNRPEGHYQQNSRWTASGDMVSQQASANAMHKDNQERMNARDALNDHIDRAEAGTTPEKAPEISRAHENDIER